MERVASRALTARAGLLGSQSLVKLCIAPSATQVATEPLRINVDCQTRGLKATHSDALAVLQIYLSAFRQAAILPAKRDHRIIEQITP